MEWTCSLCLMPNDHNKGSLIVHQQLPSLVWLKVVVGVNDTITGLFSAEYNTLIIISQTRGRMYVSVYPVQITFTVCFRCAAMLLLPKIRQAKG